MKLLVSLIIVIILFLPVQGATRFYYHSSGGQYEGAPAYDSAWEVTSAVGIGRTRTIRTGTAMTNYTSGASSVVQDILIGQLISDPIGAQTISGTVKGQARCKESNGGMNAYTAVCIRVVSNDKSTVRGTLLSVTNGTSASTELAATGSGTNRYFPASTALTAVTTQNGDRIIIELGARQTANSNNRTVSLVGGDDSATDLAEDESTTTANNPWIEFSQDIKFCRTYLIE